MKIFIYGKTAGEVISILSEQEICSKEDAILAMGEEQLSEILHLDSMRFDVGIFVLEAGKNENIFKVVKGINLRNPKCQIIYIADDYELLSQAYETRHVYYMIRGNMAEEMRQAVSLSVRKLNQKSIIVFSRENKKCYVPFHKVVYVEIQGRTLKIHTCFGEIYSTNMSISSFLDTYSEYFIRTHVSFAVNPEYISCVEYSKVKMQGNISIPISRANRKKFMGLIGEICQP